METELKTLLNMGVNIEARDQYGTTALSLAAAYGREGVVQFFSKGANVDNAEFETINQCKTSMTPLNKSINRSSSQTKEQKNAVLKKL